MQLHYQDLGQRPYMEALKIQEETLASVQNGAIDTLFLLEHPKVITLGLNADANHLLMPVETLKANGYEVLSIKRGGDVTYHGPGQIVGYTICDLKRHHGRSIKRFVHQLEALFIEFLNDSYGIEARRDPVNAGVFVGDDKITAIGLAVKRGVTMHGFAFNVNTALGDFDAIVPCGLKDRGVTSLEVLTGCKHSIPHVKEQLRERFEKTFSYTRF